MPNSPAQFTANISAKNFASRFRILILLTWNLPPVVGLAFIVFIGVLSLEELTAILQSPLEPAYIVLWIIFTLWYFPRYTRPIRDYLENDTYSETLAAAAMVCLRGFPLRYWGLFLVYLVIAPATVIYSAELYTDYIGKSIDWFRIELIALIVSIIVGLPIFFLIMDLFGKAISGIPLQRPFVSLKLKVFLIGALTPLLIDTMLIQYYWTRTGYFSTETFIVWILLEALAIGGSLIFVRSISQSLMPLQTIFKAKEDLNELNLSRLYPQSTDELGVLSNDYRELLEKLRQSRQRFFFHRQHTPLGVVEFDTNLKITEWNPAAEKIFGYRSHEVLGQNGMELLVPADKRLPMKSVWDHLVSDTGGTHSINENITRDGRIILCKWDNTTLLDERGNIIGVASLVEDITDRAEQENALRKQSKTLEDIVNERTLHLVEAKEEALRANSAKSEFLSRMSHELRTPMNAVLGFAQILELDRGLDDKHREHINEILKAGQHLMHLINEMLDLSRIESGKLHITVSEVLLDKSIEESLSIITPLAKEHGINIKYDTHIERYETRARFKSTEY